MELLAVKIIEDPVVSWPYYSVIMFLADLELSGNQGKVVNLVTWFISDQSWRLEQFFTLISKHNLNGLQKL